ncbi:MAG: cell division protein SepF [Nanoarchaeota archaeon]
MAFNRIKELFGSSPQEAEYLEIDLNSEEPKKSKILVRPFILRQFDDVNEILNSLREGYTIAVIDMKTLRAKDVVELKRAISKIKKTVEALEGTIAGFGENTLIVTPSFAEIYKAPAVRAPESNKLDTY